MRGRLDEHNPIHMIQLKPVLVLTLVRQVLPQDPVGWSGLGPGAWKWLSEGWVNSETQFQGFHGDGMARAHTPIIWPLYYPKGACAGRRYRPVAKGASSEHHGAHLKHIERGGCWCRSGLAYLLEVRERVAQTGDRSLKFRSLQQLSARSFVIGCAHPEWVPLSAMVSSI